MRIRLLICMVLCDALSCGALGRAQILTGIQAASVSSGQAGAKSVPTSEQASPPATKLDEIIDRVIKREHDEIAAFDEYSPIIETYIQEVNFHPTLGTIPKRDYYFLGESDFRGRLKVHSMTDGGKKGPLLFDPAGFLQMIYIDRARFDRQQFKIDYVRQEFLGEEAENNILDLLERDGLLAPAGEVDKLLNTVVNNIEVTNNFDEQTELRSRVLLTTNLEMFSIGNTIVITRGLVDVMANEETLAALLAHGMADALLAKPNQDQYAFSDILRLKPTEVLKRLSFEEGKIENTENSEKAMEMLKKSPYAAKLANAGLFLRQLQSRAKELKQLISPH